MYKNRHLKRGLSLLLAVLMCFTALACGTVALAAGGEISLLSFSGAGGQFGGSDRVNWWYNQDDGKYYLFVPSTAELDALSVSFNATNGVSVNGEALSNGGVTSAFAGGGEFQLTCGGTSYSLVVLKSERLPAMYISTESGTLDNVHENKSNKEPGSLLIVSGDETVYDGELDYIKGRGNSTWTYPKKPYNIKLHDKTSLFGMGKSKAWCLIASYEEESLIRNKTIYDLAEEVGLYYSSKSQHVDLYINGDYMGNYLLTEKVEVDSNRVDITDLEKLNEAANPGVDLESCELEGIRGEDSPYLKGSYKWVNIPTNPDNISGGYLLECEQATRYDAEVSGFVSQQGQPMVIKSPEYASQAEVEYIRGHYQAFEEAIFSDDGYNSYGVHYLDMIDVDSFVSMYIIQELAMNLDAGATSFYLCKDKDTELFTASPVWDFDFSLGKPAMRLGVDLRKPDLFWASVAQIPVNRVENSFDSVYNSGVASILTALYRHNDFRQLVAEKWNEVFVPALEGIDDEIRLLSEALTGSAVMESVRWNKYDTFAPAEAQQGYEADVSAVRSFLGSRIAFLSTQFVSGKLYLRYSANGGTGCTVDPYSYNRGEIVTAAANGYTREGYVFNGWNTEPDGTGYSYTENGYIKLDRSLTLYAQWRAETFSERISNMFKQYLLQFLIKIYELLDRLKAGLR